MNNTGGNRLNCYLELTKLKIMIPVTLTGFTGYFIHTPHLSVNIILVSLGILLTAVSASVLNQIQEVELDHKMKRTQNRPLPSGQIKMKNAVEVFILSLIAGIALLIYAGGIKPALIALLTLFCYNGLYTYLKRVTAFAVVPGAVTGALPPLIGWVAAGGYVWEQPVIFIEFLLFTGQIPHFWLLVLKYGEEYKEAGLPSLIDVFSRSQINRLTFTWVVSSVIAALFLCWFEIIHTLLVTGILLLASLLLIWRFSKLIYPEKNQGHYSKYSIMLNSYFFLVLILLITDRILL